MKAYLCLGSNVGNSIQHLRTALIELNTHSSIKVLKISSLYISKPVDASKQSDFYNVATKIKTRLSQHELLSFCKTIENKHQRTYHYHWGPRTLDIDIIGFGNKHITTPTLTIPHKEIPNRDFFIQPMLEIDADLHLPQIGSLKQLPTPPRNIIDIRYFDMITT